MSTRLTLKVKEVVHLLQHTNIVSCIYTSNYESQQLHKVTTATLEKLNATVQVGLFYFIVQQRTLHVKSQLKLAHQI